jgi:hypothetical protein
MLGIANATQTVSTEALRGLKSQPAVATGSTFSTNVSTNFSVDPGTDTFIVTVDDVRGEITIPQRSNYSLSSFISELEKQHQYDDGQHGQDRQWRQSQLRRHCQSFQVHHGYRIEQLLHQGLGQFCLGSVTG